MMENVPNKIGIVVLEHLIKKITVEAKQQGFNELQIIAERAEHSTSANPGHKINQIIRLVKKMKIELNNDEYKELENLIEIFEDMYIDGELIDCFSIIQDLVKNKKDIKEMVDIKRIKKQLIESLCWLEGFNVSIKYKDKYLSFFDVDEKDDFLQLNTSKEINPIKKLR